MSLSSPLTIPEILALILSHVDKHNLVACLRVARTWFDLSVTLLYREMRVVDFLRLTSTGRAESSYLAYFPVTAEDAYRLARYSPSINTLSCSSAEYKMRHARRAWRNAGSGRDFTTIPTDPLDQLASMLQSWRAAVQEDSTLLPLAGRRSDSSKKKSVKLTDLLPKLRAIRGSFDLDDGLEAIYSMDFLLPIDHLNGIVWPLYAAYNFHMDRDLRGTEVVLRSTILHIIFSDFDPAFFFLLRRSAVVADLELVLLRDYPQTDWPALLPEGSAYPPNYSKLRRLCVRSPHPDRLFMKLMESDMLGPVTPIEKLFFAVELELPENEWDMSDEEDDLFVQPFAVTDDSDDDASGSDEESDISMDSAEGTETGSDDLSDAASWLTEDQMQLPGDDAEAVEALLQDESMMNGRLPAYEDESVATSLPFSEILRDGTVLETLLRSIATSCPHLCYLGWDRRLLLRMPLDFPALSNEGRYLHLDGVIRQALDRALQPK